MHSHDVQTPNIATSAAMPFTGQPQKMEAVHGLISEVVYSQDKLWVTQCILLPLLQQLGQQSRWQLWLTPQQKLSRDWLQAAGLPLNKIMQSRQLAAQHSVNAMEKALKTGNYSVVICWLDEDLTDEEHQRLTDAAMSGQALGLIMRPMRISRSRPQNGLKIHSSLYH